MADNVAITPGSGANIATDDVSGVQFQRVKIDIGGDGVSVPVPGDNANGVDVDVTRVGGNVTVVQGTATNLKVDASGVAVPITDNSGSITVDAPVGTPAFVRLSDGSSAITTLPVSGTVAVTQSTAAASSGGWPTKITDGTDTVGISTVSTAKALKVDVIQSVSSTGSAADGSTFTATTTVVSPLAGVFNDGIADPSSGQSAGARITQKRAVHVNIRKNDGTELGIAATPLRVDPTGSTVQPVSGTVSANITQFGGSNIVAAAAGIPKVGLTDATGTAFSATNPLPIQVTGQARTRVTNSVGLSASQTAQAVWTPTGGKKFVITSIELNPSVAGTLTLFDGTNSSANIVFDGTQATGNREITFGGVPWISSAADNVLRYTSGTGLTAVITVHGYEI